MKKPDSSTAKAPGKPRAKTVTNELMDVTVVLKNLTPLLQNRVTPEQLIAIRDKIKPAKGAPKPTPREECEKKVYVTPKGKWYIPAKMLWACLVGAGQHMRLDGKRQISTAKSSMLAQFLRLKDQAMELDTPGWEVDIQQGRNPNGGELVVLCRPRFDIWRMTVNVTIDTREIAEEKMRELFDIAGMRCGLGDFRANRKGTFGQFIVESWERTSQNS